MKKLINFSPSRPHKAQEVHQEVFFKTWRRWHRYDGCTNRKAYLYQATVRKAIRLARNTARLLPVSRQPQEHFSSVEPGEPARTQEL